MRQRPEAPHRRRTEISTHAQLRPCLAGPRSDHRGAIVKPRVHEPGLLEEAQPTLAGLRVLRLEFLELLAQVPRSVRMPAQVVHACGAARTQDAQHHVEENALVEMADRAFTHNGVEGEEMLGDIGERPGGSVRSNSWRMLLL